MLLTGGRILDPEQKLDEAADLLIAGGKIAWVGRGTPPEEPAAILRLDGLTISPGFIDLHCHLREPGNEDSETIASGTRAAARGGFTTVCCMPNTDPPLDSPASVEYVQEKARTEGVVRVLPIGCITRGRRGEGLADMAELAAAGVVAFSDDGSPVSDPRLLRHALECSLTLGLPIIEHCEDPALTRDGVMHEGRVSARLGLRGMPAAAEDTMVARDIALAELSGARLHIAHVSTAGSVEHIRHARERGLSITAEVTPHHLTLTEDRVLGPPAYDTSAKVNPPLRTRRDIAALVRGLRDGTIDAIATDHAPHAPEDKLCEFAQAAFGIGGLETALGSLLALVRSGDITLMTLISKLTAEPAAIIGARELGTLRAGTPADLAIFDPQAQWLVDPEAFASRGRNTPLAGCTLTGKVMATIYGGNLAFKDDSLSLEVKKARRAGTRG
ncbi:MAG: dihydroorotase [Dehalococcoidia bacterium]